MLKRIQLLVSVTGVLWLLIVLFGCSGPGRNGSDNEISPSPNSAGAGAVNSPITLTDVTKQSGITFVHRHGGSGRRYMVETFAGGAAFLDFDGDGWQDIFLVQSAPLPGDKSSARLHSALYRNRNGKFTDVTKGSGLDVSFYGMAPSVGDYDNDGRPDLFVSAVGGNRLFHNEGGGKFKDVTRVAGVGGKDWSTSAMWLDYNRDGYLDLFVCRYTDYSFAKDILCKQAGVPIYCNPERYRPTHSLLYRNNGNGTFADVTQKSGIARASGRALGVAPVDANKDGWIDIYVACDQTRNLLFKNNKNGTFREDAVASGVTAQQDYGGMGVDSGDYKNDGRVSLVVTNYLQEPITLFSDGGNGVFSEEYNVTSSLHVSGRRYVKWGCRFVDLDLDGLQDLFVVNGHVNDRAPAEDGDIVAYPQPAQVFRNVQKSFQDISPQCGPFFSRTQVGRAAAFGDYDNDSDTDILIACNNQPAILLRNDSKAPPGPKPNSGTVRISLQGSANARTSRRGCNRDALGASVRVRGRSVTQTQWMRSGTSYLADHDRRLLFGIGQDKQVQVEVRWPCGATQNLQVRAGSNPVIHEKNCRLAAGARTNKK